jgi:hypothetical protein
MDKYLKKPKHCERNSNACGSVTKSIHMVTVEVFRDIDGNIAWDRQPFSTVVNWTVFTLEMQQIFVFQ